MKKPLDTLAALTAIGFSDKEARTYLASLALGPATVADIAAQAKLTRPSVYLMIEALERRGMMTTYKVGKKSMYRAGPPQALRYINAQARANVEKKEKAVGQVVKALNTISNGEGGILIRFWDGPTIAPMIQDMALATKLPSNEIVNLERTRRRSPLHYPGDKRVAVGARGNHKSVVQESEGYQLDASSKSRSVKKGRDIAGQIGIVDNHTYFTYKISNNDKLQVINDPFAKTLRALFEAIYNDSNGRY